MKFEDLKDKKVLVTGSSGGIGAAIVELFAAEGANVGIHYNKNEKKAKSLLKSVKEKTKEAAVFKSDFLKVGSYSELISSFIRRFGSIDILVNSSGAVYGHKDFIELDAESWDDTFSLNVKAPFFLSREAFKAMKAGGGGKIINMSSISSKYGGSRKTVHYSAAKAALETITLSLAKMGAEHNILVNAVKCGVIDTDFHKKLKGKDLKERISLIPLGRAGQPREIANIVGFLASSAGNFITGEIFTAAGGE